MKIFFICTGNTCRSPMAQGLFEKLLRDGGDSVSEVSSAGLFASTGAPASAYAVEAAAKRGADISAHRARQFSEYMAREGDLFVAMTRAHAAELERSLPEEKILVLGDGIADPYGGDAREYDKCAEAISDALAVLYQKVQKGTGFRMKKYDGISFAEVEITGGFWSERQKLNREVTLPQVYKQFERTGRFSALNCAWREGEPNKPHIFWDSDSAKWLESAALVLRKAADDELMRQVEDCIDIIEREQRPDGYFNSYFTACEPSKRFTVRDWHELYCAGHFIEAAVAYYEATGRDRFLNLMRRYADYIEKVFVTENSAAFSTPGHEEIELALVKLWRCTGERRYLELSLHFINLRGTPEAKESSCTDPFHYGKYKQDIPVREQTEAVGHAVRACYLYCAMADLAREYGDSELFAACDRIFRNITKRRMYITGGIGSTREGEAFTGDFDLPNDRAYAETCAAISLVMFANRMSLCAADSLYADTAERALYNGVLAGLSLDGRSFFYENPLEINLRSRSSDENALRRWSITQRVEVFGCSCCPPNLTRFIASLGGMLYTHGDGTLFVNHYAEGSARFTADGADISVTQRTEYPFKGAAEIRVKGIGGRSIALRIPSWCGGFSITDADGDIPFELRSGYAYVRVDSDEYTLTLTLDDSAKFVYADTRVLADAGRLALMKGPFVYCAEGVDNGAALDSLRIDADCEISEGFDEDLRLPALYARAFEEAPNSNGELYSHKKPLTTCRQVKFIPYFAFANRGESDMSVWMRY